MHHFKTVFDVLASFSPLLYTVGLKMQFVR